MNNLSRREFIARGATGLAAGASLLSPFWLRAGIAEPKEQFIGLQSWIVREDIGKDMSGTLKKLGAMGFNQIEMCSPPGYADLGFGPLVNLKAAEMKSIMGDAGFGCVSCHYGFRELNEHQPERVEYAKVLGLSQMVISSYGLRRDATLDDWKKAADDTNRLGEQAHAAGIQLAYHNHSMEFDKLDGQLIYDVLLDRLDPNLVKMQFQVQVVMLGYKAADYFRKYPGRFISAHLYDWSGTGEELVALGKGVVDWQDFFKAAKTGGLKNYYVEMGMPLLKDSAAFLKTTL